MKKFSTWMILMFVVLFWILRIVVALTANLNVDFVIKPFNTGTEIALIFFVLLCMVLIVKRKMVGAVLYLVAYCGYFGTDALSNFYKMMTGTISAATGLGAFVSLIGVILPVAVLIDMLADKARAENPKDKKTDWFYQNEKFDRQLDERADRNNYRL